MKMGGSLKRAAVVLVLGGYAAGIACGGSNTSNESGGIEAGADTTAGGTGGGASSGAGASSGSGGGSSGTSSGASGGSSSGSADDGGSMGASEGGRPSDGGAPDVSPDTGAGPGVGVLCGDERDGGHPPRCVPGDVCCVAYPADGGPIPTYTCQSASAPCTGTSSAPSTVVSCASSVDCPDAELCCGKLGSGTGGNGYAAVSCAPSCNLAPGDGGTPYEFCDLNAPSCPDGSPPCRASLFLTGYAICF